MNKRIIIVLFLLCVPSVLAKEGVIRKYKYYYLDRIYGPYSEEASFEYPYINYDDYIYTDYIESLEEPLDKPNREIEETIYYKYKRIKNIKYIRIKNNSNPINVSNIDLKYNGEDINYTISSTSGEDSLIESGGYLTIQFQVEIDQSLVKLKIESDAFGSGINIITADDICNQSIYRCTIGNMFEWDGTNATYYSYSSWVEDIYPFKLSSGRVVIYQGKATSYRYRDKLYRTYREEKIYSLGYLVEPKYPFVIKDEYDFIEENVRSEEDSLEADNNKNSLLDDGDSLDNNETTLFLKNDDLSDDIIDVPNTSDSYIHELLEKEMHIFLHFLSK